MLVRYVCIYGNRVAWVFPPGQLLLFETETILVALVDKLHWGLDRGSPSLLVLLDLLEPFK